QLLLKHVDVRFITGTGWQRHIHGVALTTSRARFRRRASARVEGILVRAKVEDTGVRFEDVLCAVAVVHVPVDDQNVVEPMLLLEIARQNGDIIEQTKTHGAVGLRMVPWRPYSTEHLRHLAAHHRISGRQGSCHSFQSSVTRITTNDGIRIEGYGGALARY